FVVALCSLYYLPDDSINQLVRYLSTITGCLVAEVNTASDIGRSDPHTYEKASVHYTRRVLTTNGFPSVNVIAPFQYTHPLIIGKSATSAPIARLSRSRPS